MPHIPTVVATVDSASSFQPMPDPYDEAQRLKDARDALFVSETLSKMAVKYGPKLVIDTVRYWLDFMDRQAARIDGAE